MVSNNRSSKQISKFRGVRKAEFEPQAKNGADPIMFPSADDRAVVIDQLDDYLKTILRFKIREFVHLSPCFEAIPSIDVRRYPIDIRNYRRLLSLDHTPQRARDAVCRNKKRVKATRRKISRYLVV